MASPSGTSETPRKNGVKCDGKIKKGRREGQECGMLLLAKDSPEREPSIVCSRPQCGDHMTISALLSKAVKIWGEPFRKTALSILAEKNQEKGSHEMPNYELGSQNQEKSNCELKIKKRTRVLIGKHIALGVVGDLLPFTKGEIINQIFFTSSDRKLKVKEVTTEWVEDVTKNPKEIIITRDVQTEVVRKKRIRGRIW